MDGQKKKEFQMALQTVVDKFTTSEMVNKLAPCGSTQQNESIHGMVGTLASKRLFLEEESNGNIGML